MRHGQALLHTSSRISLGAQDERTDMELLKAIERACTAQYLAGHTERAVACLQALVEFNCYPPDPGMNIVFFQFLRSGYIYA